MAQMIKKKHLVDCEHKKSMADKRWLKRVRYWTPEEGRHRRKDIEEKNDIAVML